MLNVYFFTTMTYTFVALGEEERMKDEMKEKDDFNFSFLKIAEIVGIAPDTTLCL